MKPERKLFSIVESETKPSPVALPFVKWVGGKRSLITAIKDHLPAEFNNYHEPFAGGGAVYFGVGSHANKAFLSDKNIELVITYKVIKDDPTHLIARLKQHAEAHNEEYYYSMRAAEQTDPVEVAARFIYLNKTCFNGLYRVISAELRHVVLDGR